MSFPSIEVKQKTILVVEDDPDVVRLIRLVLQNDGHIVLSALDGENALATCRRYRHRIDLLLTDIVLTGMRGTDLAKQLYEAYPGLSVIFMTGYPVEQVRGDIGMVPHELLLTKPIKIGSLVEKVAGVLALADDEANL